MAQADTLAYWNSMQSRRDSVPLVATSSSGLVSYGGQLGAAQALTKGSDLPWLAYCSVGWLELGLPPSHAAAQLCFASDYFAWCTGYLSDALRMAPGPSSSAEFRVLWTLDVWAHVTYALFALNLNWADTPAVSFAGENLALARANAAPTPLARQLLDRLLQLESYWKMSYSAAVSAAKRSSSSAQASSYSSTALVPPVFATLPVFWCGNWLRTWGYRDPNPLWPALLQAIQPWSSNWSRNWLGSNVDGADIMGYANDAPLAYATMQWRLFALRDAAGTTKTPLLSQYIAHVVSESTDETFAFDGPYARATHAWSMAVVKDLAGAVAALNYGTVVRDAVANYAAAYLPRLNPDGSLMTVDQVRAAQGLPATGGAGGTALAQTFLTAQDLVALAKARNVAVAQAYMRQLQQNANSIVDSLAATVGLALVKKYGIAEGCGAESCYIAFGPLPAPFARTLVTPNWSYAPVGSSGDIWSRFGAANMNFEATLPGLFTAAPAVARKNCTTKQTPLAEFCTICDDGTTSPPGCDGAAPAPSQAGVAPPATPDPCAMLLVSWKAMNPHLAPCLQPADESKVVTLCHAAQSGRMSQAESAASIAAAIDAACRRAHIQPPPKTALQAFGQALYEGTNPLRGRVESRLFLNRLTVPINPARWWTGG